MFRGVSMPSHFQIYNMGRYPANTVAANIKDHYTVFAPLLNKAKCIWDLKDKDYGKETARRKAYSRIETKLGWKGMTMQYRPCNILSISNEKS